MTSSHGSVLKLKRAWEILFPTTQLANNSTNLSWKLIFNRNTWVAIFCLAIIAIPFVGSLIYTSETSRSFLYGSIISQKLTGFLGYGQFRREKHMSQMSFSTLQKILEKASMPNKTVIITTLNGAWAENNSMFDFFLESFHNGVGTENLLDHLIVATLDEKAHNLCIHTHPHCYMLVTKGVDFSEEKQFMTADYLEMMWTRILFLTILLENGYSFLFSDTDIMWFRNPFPYFSPDYDFQIASDEYFGNPTDMKNKPNGGFVFVRANNRTVNFYKYWYRSRKLHPNHHDQDVLNDIKYEKSFLDIGLKMQFLETQLFGCFCSFSDTNMDIVITMHANCCIGLKAKLQDLKSILDDWHQYRSNGMHDRMYWRSPYACPNSWH